MRRATLVPATREHQKVSFTDLRPPDCCAASLLALLEGARSGFLPEESKTTLGAETSHEVPLSKFLTAFLSSAVDFWGSCSLSS